MMGPMGEIVLLAEYRDRRHPELTVLQRLDRAVERLDSIVTRRPGRMAPTVERELLLIARAVSSGMPLEAADRAERLADLLEHPAASGS
jgi:protein gp37